MYIYVYLYSDEDDDVDLDFDGELNAELSKQIKKRADRRARRKLKAKQKQLSMEEEVLNARKKIARAKKKSGAELAGAVPTAWSCLQPWNLYILFLFPRGYTTSAVGCGGLLSMPY